MRPQRGYGDPMPYCDGVPATDDDYCYMPEHTPSQGTIETLGNSPALTLGVSSKGTVAFGSGLHGWGDSFFNNKKKTWTNVMQPEGCDKPLERAFCQFIMTPINQLMTSIMNDDKAKYEKMMGSLGIVLKGDEKHLTGKPLMKRTMQIWINAADTLLSMIVTKLPSPVIAQKYRVENLYEGPMDDTAAKAMRARSHTAALIMLHERPDHVTRAP